MGEVRKVAEKVGVGKAVIAELESVGRHTQFGRSVDSIRPAVPESLLIDGHNPLTLLHSALSEAIHDKSDTYCLELAQDIRTVLVELADRSATILRDHAELKGAVSRLQNRAAKKGASSSVSSLDAEIPAEGK